MKKSKFLQNSKDMLSRSFNPAKCKTALRLAGSRLKLLSNKKEVQVKQMRREIAQLLESGQDRTARIRVEHVVREEKMMAAYNLLEIYCELIVARLPIIESQKNIPIDLKEAIASVVFAAPRCGDVPELLDVRKHFTAKYGKDFTTAAIELRPDCGVGRMLVEKLSAMAPDVQAKIKILSAIAEEHNVSWEPKSFEEKDSVHPNDLLSGPNTFAKASTLIPEPPHVEVQAPPINSKMDSSSLNISQQDSRTSGIENLSSAQNSSVSTTFQPETKPPGDKKTEVFQEDSYMSSMERPKWNMEFKDATSAAQAAAESAERASMAARAAAELSNRDRIMRQNSTKSHNSDGFVLRDEGREAYTTSRLTSEQFPEDSANRSSAEETRLQREQMDRFKPYNGRTSGKSKDDSHRDTKEHSQSASLKSKASKDTDSVNHGAYSQRNSSKISGGEMSMKKQSFKHEAESTDGWPEKSENFREKIKKQPSVNSSHSRPSSSDDLNIFADSKDQKFGCDDDEDPSSGIGKEGIHREASIASLNSKVSKDNDLVDHGVPVVDVYSRNNSSKVRTGEMSMKKQSFKAERTSGWPEKSENFREERIMKQPSVSSSRSHSSISDDVNIFAYSEDNFRYDAGEDSSVGIGKEGIHGEASHEPAAVVFDKSDSDSDGHGFDLGPSYDEQESVFHVSSFVKKSPDHLPKITDSWSPRSSSSKMVKSTSPSLFSMQKNSSSDFSENLMSKDGSELDKFMPVKFDDSDGPTSESDEDMNMTRHTGMEDLRLPSKQNKGSHFVRSEFKNKSGQSFGFPVKTKGYSRLERKQSSFSSDDELNMDRETNQGKKINAGSPEKPSLGKLSVGQPVLGPNKSQIELNEFGNESSPETVEGLNFGKLTGGLRHKAYNRPPHLKDQTDGSSSLKKKTKETTTTNRRSVSPPVVDSPKINSMLDQKKGTIIPDFHSDTDSDSSEEGDSLQKSSGQRQEQYSFTSGVEVKAKSGLGASSSIFGSDNSDLDEDAPKDTFTRKSHLQSGISRRTKASSSSSKLNSAPKTRLKSQALDSDARGERKSTISKDHETPGEFESQSEKSQKWENYERPTSAKVSSKPAKSSFWGPPEHINSANETYGTLRESTTRLKSQALDSDARKERKSTISKDPETPGESESQSKKSQKWENYERPTSAKVSSKPAKSSFWGPPEHINSAKETYGTMQESTTRLKSEGLNSDDSKERKPINSNTSEIPEDFQSPRRNSSQLGNSKQPNSERIASKPSNSSLLGTPEQPNSEKSTSASMHKAKISPKTSASEEPPSPRPKTQNAVSNENPKAATNKDDSPKKASHVHPKLPDYDFLVQSLRKNRP